MIKLKNIVSLYKPDPVVENGVLVYVRENIREIIVTDELFNTEKPAYMYNEKRYTKEEYEDMKFEKELTEIKEDVKIMELAIAEILENTEKNNQPVSLNTIYSQYSAISQMYANMIEKGIYTIDRVPERWRAEVEAVLAENAKED